ncbi:MAG: anti-sigma factor [Janthinobacterium lividum]
MEDTQEYIDSGRLLQYALGELDAAGQAEVEARAARSPEVRQELDELLAGLGVYAEAHAQTPPAALRERVLGRVLAEISSPAVTPAAPVAAVPAMRVSASNPANAQPVAAAPVARTSGWAIAASVALLLSLAANALLYSRWQQADLALATSQTTFARTTEVVERFKVAQIELKQVADKLTVSQEQLHALRSPSEYKMVALAGTPAHRAAHARVLFNAASHRVYVDVQQLPALPAGKQYQLWALNNGKPVDAGMLDARTASGDSLQQMKDVAGAQAFAMTVEPRGGSAGPTMDTMTVIGSI